MSYEGFKTFTTKADNGILWFTIADEKDMQRDMDNQRNWNGLVENVQGINCHDDA